LNTAPEAGVLVTGDLPRPGVNSSYSWGWQVMWPKFGLLLLIMIVYMAIGGLASMAPFLGTLLIGIPLQFGTAYSFLLAARREKLEIDHVFRGFQDYWNSVGAGLLVMLIVICGLILLIIPGLVFACKLAFVPYLVTDRKMSASAAIQKSWEMSRGHAMEVFAIMLIGILLAVAGLICLIVGVIVATIWTEAALASLYFAISSREVDEAAPLPAPAAGS
jgi:hypothetical protein